LLPGPAGDRPTACPPAGGSGPGLGAGPQLGRGGPDDRGPRRARRGIDPGRSHPMKTAKPDRRSGPAIRRILGYARPHLRGQRLVAVGGTIALLGEVAFRVLEPWPVKVLI